MGSYFTTYTRVLELGPLDYEGSERESLADALQRIAEEADPSYDAPEDPTEFAVKHVHIRRKRPMEELVSYGTQYGDDSYGAEEYGADEPELQEEIEELLETLRPKPQEEYIQEILPLEELEGLELLVEQEEPFRIGPHECQRRLRAC